MPLEISQSDSQPDKVGLLAGWGNYPLIVAKSLLAQGTEVYCMAIRGHADPELEEICTATRWVKLSGVGAGTKFCRKHGVQFATMAGKIHKVRLFDRHFLWNNFPPDLLTIKTFVPHFVRGTKDRKDDTLLLAVVDAFASQGITMLPATNYSPELLVKQGQLSGKPLDQKRMRDVVFGWNLAREMGRLDVGQSVVVKGQAAIAIEAIEGTDQCIRRAAQLCNSGRLTVVKVAKPQQDMRFDVPTIGVGTLQTMSESGATTLVVEAEKTIILEEEDVIQFAKEHGITIIASTEEMMAEYANQSKAA